ncbi:MAG TPA: DUF2231 domain-containing protein [Acidiferrobacterales bacterium]|nr:DUF2231 domain-containing protein [Acidiferrobacterales bacterium]
MLKAVYLWHPIFVHFSVALLTVATGFYVLATLFKKNRLQPQWLTVAHWNFGVGLAMTVLTLLFGWLAFNTVSHDAAAHDAIAIHRNLALVTASGFGLLGLAARWHRASPHYPTWWFTALLVLCFGLLMVTGLRGGELVYHYGLAVQSIPKPAKSTNGVPHLDHGQESHAD